MLNKKALAATAAADKLYVEDVFSTYLFTGTGSSQTITNNIDLSTEGGLVWTKRRDASSSHGLYDTLRGTTKRLRTNTTDAEDTLANSVTAFNTDGFSIGSQFANAETYASWTFRKAEKFFDVVTYTGNGADNRAIAHNLGSTPGCVILKCTSTGSTNWLVQHRSVAADRVLILNGTNASFGSNSFSDQYADSTSFYVDNTTESNNNGSTYVAYLFAHDAGGFGDSGSESVIKCGSFTTPSSGLATIELGYEPQWLMVKCSSNTGDWWIVDNMRGFSQTFQARLDANASWAEETTTSPWFKPTATGFTASADSIGGSRTHIYIAIRRGPMKTPEAGSSVFEPFVDRTSIANKTNGTMGPVDMTMQTQVSDPLAGYHWTTFDRLRGANKYINTSELVAEATDTSVSFDVMGGVKNATWFSSGGVGYNFKRAPKFFDIVCYSGTGSATTQTHNLGVVPELMIIKRRDASSATGWIVYASPLSNPETSYLILNGSDAVGTGNTVLWNSTAPTSSVFSLGTSSNLNASGSTNVAYLFATLAGVSKVGSYTGNGSSQTINCGFTGGARFVLIKRTDSTGDWVVFDSARGIVSGNDPYLELNTTDAEVTDKDAVDTDNTGFVVNETTGPNINTNGASYIYLAIA